MGYKFNPFTANFDLVTPSDAFRVTEDIPVDTPTIVDYAQTVHQRHVMWMVYVYLASGNVYSCVVTALNNGFLAKRSISNVLTYAWDEGDGGVFDPDEEVLLTVDVTDPGGGESQRMNLIVECTEVSTVHTRRIANRATASE